MYILILLSKVVILVAISAIKMCKPLNEATDTNVRGKAEWSHGHVHFL